MDDILRFLFDDLNAALSVITSTFYDWNADNQPMSLVWLTLSKVQSFRRTIKVNCCIHVKILYYI